MILSAYVLALSIKICDTDFADKSSREENIVQRGLQGSKRRGRPTLPQGKAKRYPTGFRTTKEMKDFLQRMADSSGRSIAQEVEHRLEQSAEFERTFGGPRLVALWRELAAAAEQVSPGDDSWLDDYCKFAVIRGRWERILDAATPTPADPTEEKIARGDAAIRSLKARQQLGQHAHELWQAIDVLRSLFAPADELKRLANDPDLPPEKRAEFAAAAGSASTSTEETR